MFLFETVYYFDIVLNSIVLSCLCYFLVVKPVNSAFDEQNKKIDKLMKEIERLKKKDE